MSVWPTVLPAHAPLSGREGELIQVQISTEPRLLEDVLECLASVPFPINPQIYHGLPTIVEFPAYERHLYEVRDASPDVLASIRRPCASAACSRRSQASAPAGYLALQVYWAKPMRLILGPPGSGKTTSCLDRLRDALRAKRETCRLIVPTATMGEHLRNELAREGFVFKPALVSTFTKFVEPYCVATPGVTSGAIEIIVAEVLARTP